MVFVDFEPEGLFVGDFGVFEKSFTGIFLLAFPDDLLVDRVLRQLRTRAQSRSLGDDEWLVGLDGIVAVLDSLSLLTRSLFEHLEGIRVQDHRVEFVIIDVLLLEASLDSEKRSLLAHLRVVEDANVTVRVPDDDLVDGLGPRKTGASDGDSTSITSGSEFVAVDHLERDEIKKVEEPIDVCLFSSCGGSGCEEQLSIRAVDAIACPAVFEIIECPQRFLDVSHVPHLHCPILTSCCKLSPILSKRDARVLDRSVRFPADHVRSARGLSVEDLE